MRRIIIRNEVIKPDSEGKSKPIYSELAVDKTIEKHEYRKEHIPDKQSGLLSISIVPGEKFIGQLILSPQFEARWDEEEDPRRFQDCQTAQDEYLLKSLDCLDEFLENVSGDDIDWNLSIASHPCPGAAPPDSLLIERVATREVALQDALDQVREARRVATVSPQAEITKSVPVTRSIEVKE